MVFKPSVNGGNFPLAPSFVVAGKVLAVFVDRVIRQMHEDIFLLSVIRAEKGNKYRRLQFVVRYVHTSLHSTKLSYKLYVTARPTVRP